MPRDIRVGLVQILEFIGNAWALRAPLNAAVCWYNRAIWHPDPGPLFGPLPIKKGRTFPLELPGRVPDLV